MPAPIAVINPLLPSTVAEPLPPTIANVIAPPRPPVADVVIVAVNVPSTLKVFAEVIVKVGVVLPIVINCEVLAAIIRITGGSRSERNRASSYCGNKSTITINSS